MLINTRELDVSPGSPSNKAPDRPDPVSSPHERREEQDRYTLKTLFTLLIVLCVYCLGSLSLAPHLLPVQTTRPGVITTGGGACTATPNDLHYLSSSQGNTLQLPQVGSNADFDEHDLAYAQACAGFFVIAYQSFDFSQTQTFEASTSMLSVGARQRFEGNTPNKQTDIRLNPFWRASIQKQQLRQSVQVGLPDLLDTQYINNRMLVWMQVHYQLTVQRNYDSFTREDDITILVVSVPNKAGGQKTWQIADWKDGHTVFAPPDPL